MSKAPQIIVATAAACLLPVGAAITFIIAHEALIHAANRPLLRPRSDDHDSSFGRRLGYQTARRSVAT
jgi:hypothetical protein